MLLAETGCAAQEGRGFSTRGGRTPASHPVTLMGRVIGRVNGLAHECDRAALAREVFVHGRDTHTDRTFSDSAALPVSVAS